MTKFNKKQAALKRPKNFFISLISCFLLVLAFFSAQSIFASESGATQALNEALIAEVRSKIDALPEAENITIENAAVVTSQIQEIDQIKFDLTDADYEELIRRTDAWSGGEYGERPAKYFAACKALIKLQNSSGQLVMRKKVLGDFGMDLETEMLDLSKSKISFSLQKIDENGNDTGAPISLSMYGMTHDYSIMTLNELDPSTGSTAPFKQAITPMTPSSFYNRTETNAWGTAFTLPAGKYRIVEDTTTPMMINGKSYPTATVTYSYNGVETTDGPIIEVPEKGYVTVMFSNMVISIVFDQGNNILTGTEGQKLDSISFPEGFPTPTFEDRYGDQVTVDGHWTWENGNITTLNASDENQQFCAIFTPDDPSYLYDSAYDWKYVDAKGNVIDAAVGGDPTGVRIPLKVNVKEAEPPKLYIYIRAVNAD